MSFRAAGRRSLPDNGRVATRNPRLKTICWLLAASLLSPAALAHGDQHSHGHGGAAAAATASLSNEVHAWGRQGDPTKAARTVRVTMHDTMRFDPSQLTLRRGQTVTFVVHNAGRLMHEFVIGTHASLEQHAAAMAKHPGMEHDAPYMAHVAPGKTQRISWTFTEAGDFLAGCLVPGHWQAGMKARLRVQR